MRIMYVLDSKEFDKINWDKEVIIIKYKYVEVRLQLWIFADPDFIIPKNHQNEVTTSHDSMNQ